MKTIILRGIAMALFLGGNTLRANEIVIDTDQVVREIDRTQILGQNIALWYNPALLTNPQTFQYLRDAGIGGIRIPGGSWSDMYFWNGNGVRNNFTVDPSKYHDYQWDIDYSDWAPGFNAQIIPGEPNTPKIPSQVALSIKDLHEFVQKLGCETMAIANAGTGNARLASEWLRWANLKQGYHVKYWEIGNELEGGWEAGNTRPDGSKMTGEKYAAIFSEFARAMRQVDPNIKIGGPTSTHPRYVPIPEFLENITEPIDFLSFHVYARNRSKTTEGWAKEALRITRVGEDLRGLLREYCPDRADKIEIHLTEFNIWPQDVPTVSMDVGIWTAISIGELLRSEIDHCWFWDTFTVNQTTGQGHGFLFPTKEGIIRKSQYWAFYLFYHYFGNRILSVQEDSDSGLYTYASTDDQGRLRVIVVNGTTHPIVSSVQLQGQSATKYNTIQSATFSESEYKWNFPENRPWWTMPPRERQLATARIVDYSFPPASFTAFTFSKNEKSPAIIVSGQRPLRFPCAGKPNLQILVLDENGQPASDVPIAVRSDRKAVLPPRKAQIRTDALGRATLSFASAKKPTKGTLRIAAKLASGKVVETRQSLEVVTPELEIICPDSVEAGQEIPLLFLFHGGTNEYGARETFDLSLPLAVRDAHNQLDLRLNQGVASATWKAPRSPQKMHLSATLPGYHLTVRHEIEVYRGKAMEACMLPFDDQRDLQAIRDIAPKRISIDDSVRPNQGVLAFIPSATDSNRIRISMNRLPDSALFQKIQHRITGCSIEIHLPHRTRIPANATIRWELTSGADTFRTTTPIGKLRPGKWETLRVELPLDKLDEYSQIHTIALTLQNVGSVKTIHFDNFTLFYKDRK